MKFHQMNVKIICLLKGIRSFLTLVRRLFNVIIINIGFEISSFILWKCVLGDETKYRVYQNNWSGLEVDYIHKYGEQNYKYW